MKVLVACEYSGIVRDAFIKRGHDAISCDLLPTESPGPHYQGNVFDIINDGFDLMIAHPPCTYLCSSGLHWNKRRPERERESIKALEFVKALWAAPINKIAIENPIGALSTKFMKPTQIIQPWYFGELESKATCLWLKNIPPLYHVPQDDMFYRRTHATLPNRGRWNNQTDSGQNRLAPGPDRWKERAKTYGNIAAAMAEQWGNL